MKQKKRQNPVTLFVFKVFLFLCLDTFFPYSRDYIVSPVSSNFPYSRDFVVSSSRHFWAIVGSGPLRVERRRCEARREKFTRENFTLPTIYLGLAGQTPAWA